MAALFPHLPQALENTVRIAERCNLELAFGRAHLPAFRPIPEGMTSAGYLRALCFEGLAARYGGTERWRDSAFRAEAERRLAYELDVIERMGYCDYFLIVWDFIRFARERGIRTGPGRGSAAGSLAAYTLFITDVDPLKHKLLFERFLNPERVSMPDIDIDFDDERRDEVIAYVTAKYGEEHVAQIITFGTLAARAAVRDVGRALAVPYAEVDRTAKLIPNQPGMTLEKALETSPELRALCESNPRVDHLVKTALKVEGMPRHASTHAAGVVISRDPLTDHVPLQSGGEGTALTQYPMDALEAVGLLKMDFLGLRTLSIIERTLAWIRKLYGQTVDFRRVRDDDPKTYDMLARGETTGVFQLESAGMRRVLRDLKPSVFEDLVSVLALYRPGPMEFIPQYIAGKHGRVRVTYPHPSLEPILADTYGIIVYQEQIMQIASKMAGFSLGEADLLRRAVSKKKRETLDREREHFVAGSVKQGYTADEANAVYDMIVRFADYGFPRAHAVAYAVLAFQTAYLKAHYPIPFMASMLASVTGNQRKTAEYVDECRRMGIPVLPPDIGESEESFTPTESAIRFGLGAVKNVGTHAIEAIKAARAERPFESLLDLCRRVDLRVVNKRVLESLILSGACDGLPGHRAQLLAALDETIEAVAKWRKEREELQIELFGIEEVNNWEVELPEVKPYTRGQQLEFERELLGIYLSGHPLDEREAELERLGVERLYELADAPDGAMVVTSALIVSVKPFTTRKGQQMGFLELEDRIARVEAVVFQSVWKRSSFWLEKGKLALVLAVVQQQEEDFKLVVEEIVPMDGPNLAPHVRRMRDRIRARVRRQAPGAPGAGPGTDRGGAAAGNGAARGIPRAGSDLGGSPAEAGGDAGGGSGKPVAARGLGRIAMPGGAAAPAGRPGPVGSPADAFPPGRPDADGAHPRPPFGSRSGAAVPAFPRAEAPAAPGAPCAPTAARRTAREQRVFIRIPEDREQPGVLHELRRLLDQHPGPLRTVLYYERDHRTIELGDSVRVKPSRELFAAIGRLLGAGTAVVK
jgi:DNA polymerase-3 subunit alpha